MHSAVIISRPLFFASLLVGMVASPALSEPDFTDPSRGPGYGAAPWATVHGDSRNSDYVPMQTGTALEHGWRALEGSVSWTAPSVGLDGTLYVTTGRGRGSDRSARRRPWPAG